MKLHSKRPSNGTSLSSGGYLKGDRETFDPVRCLDASVLIPFIKETQPKEWDYLANLQKDQAEKILLDDLGKALDSPNEGCLSRPPPWVQMLWKTFQGRIFRTCKRTQPGNTGEIQGQPAHYHPPGEIFRKAQQFPRYRPCPQRAPGCNRRTEKPDDRPDLRRMPLNNTSSTGTTNDLIFQFKKRALVHFAVDPDEVYMTTKLAGRLDLFPPLQ